MKVSKDLREHIEAQVRAKAAPALKEINALIEAEEEKAREFHTRLDAMAEPVRRKIAAEVEKAFGGGLFKMKYRSVYKDMLVLPHVGGRGDFETPDLRMFQILRSDIMDMMTTRTREIVAKLELGGKAEDLERMLSETSFEKFLPDGGHSRPRRKGGAE